MSEVVEPREARGEQGVARTRTGRNICAKADARDAIPDVEEGNEGNEGAEERADSRWTLAWMAAKDSFAKVSLSLAWSRLCARSSAAWLRWTRSCSAPPIDSLLLL